MEFNLLFFNLFFELIVLYDIYLKPYKLYQSILAQQRSVRPARALEMGLVWPFQPGLHTKFKLLM